MQSESLVSVLQKGLATSLLYMLAVTVVVYLAMTVGPAVLKAVEEAKRKMGIGLRVLFLFSAAIATLQGGAKRKIIQDAGSDDGIALAGIVVDYDSTNDVTAVEVNFVGVNVTTATPVWVRNDQSEVWRELAKDGATVTTDLETNVLAFAAAGDVSTNRYWWVGTDTPAVIVETKGIEITHFAASSSSVQIMWTCDDPNATEYVIQRRRKGAANWETVGVTSSLAFVYVGFTVGETWEWRVTSTYTEVE